jgi:hypothetical protein
VPRLTGSNLNLDDVRSFFSDNSSEQKHGLTLRKRFYNLRSSASSGIHASKGKSLRRDRSSFRHLNLLHRNQNPSRQQQHPDNPRGHHSLDGTGHTTTTSTYEAEPSATTTISHPGTPTLFDHLHSATTAGNFRLPSTTALAASATSPPYPTATLGTAVVGMGKTEFHVKRLGAKLRLFLARSGDLFRTFSAGMRSGGGVIQGRGATAAAAAGAMEGRRFAVSVRGNGARRVVLLGRRRRAREREDSEDWLADSVYSGSGL